MDRSSRRHRLPLPATTLEWDAKALSFKNVKEANQFVKRTYRKGWEVQGLS